MTARLNVVAGWASDPIVAFRSNLVNNLPARGEPFAARICEL